MDIIKKIFSKKIIISTIIKYAFSLVLTFIACFSAQKKGYFIVGCMELAIIFVVSNLALLKSKRIGWILNSVLVLFYNIQMGVMLFGNSYITIIMLDNIPSLDGLSGKIVLYSVAAIIVLIIGIMPVYCFEKMKFCSTWFCPLSFLLCGELLFTMIFGSTYSPMYGYVDLLKKQYQRIQMEKQIKAIAQSEDVVDKYYSQGVESYRDKDVELCDEPNVILIFTEGLSQHIVEDERELMPNVYEYEKKSLLFDNYYNHTFATYCGIISQLYSGYQWSNLDENPLVSIQSVLGDEGYDTAFINTEPKNKDFTNYLKALGYNSVIGDENGPLNGGAKSISDKDAYDLLYRTACEKSKSDTPFFLTMYTYGTHTSFDSPDEKFGDGKDAMLNKYHNVDFQFGEFMKKFEESELAEDTLVIFTTDHATYTDDSYNKAFPETSRVTTTLDEVPFFIYYKGIEPEAVDVRGRNSICLVPTILDYLDITAPNYFMGTSLFATEPASIRETSYYDSNGRYTSNNCSISLMTVEDQGNLETQVTEYFALKEVMQQQK